MEGLTIQIVTLLILAVPVACIAWTVTHEEVFRELREWCECRSKTCQSLAKKKLFYLPTCEYCFSHYVAVFVLLITEFKVLYPDWRGYFVSFFALIWVGNLYMGIFGRLRLDIKREKVEIKKEESKI